MANQIIAGLRTACVPPYKLPGRQRPPPFTQCPSRHCATPRFPGIPTPLADGQSRGLADTRGGLTRGAKCKFIKALSGDTKNPAPSSECGLAGRITVPTYTLYWAASLSHNVTNDYLPEYWRSEADCTSGRTRRISDGRSRVYPCGLIPFVFNTSANSNVTG